VPVQRIEEVTVVDLSSLWAGPLCASLLSAIGARVIKVESTRRPDGARRGPAGFYDLLNAGKESVALDFTDEDDRRRLRRLVESADVVIEGSRPRALEHLGIDARSGRARVWLSITGHGRNQPMRIGYGDDAAVAGGLVARDDDGPLFIADAVADPITGLLGAVAVLDLLRNGGIWLVDLALARSAALAAGSASASAITIADAAPPRHRIPPRRAARLGDHNDAVLSRLGG
jgi:crotonobetainyl-CoA:carnitine CoA-transferase CaiB-like acyl-CoA transferase